MRMKIKLRSIVMVLMAVMVSCFPAKAVNINMLDDDRLETEIPNENEMSFGVEIESFYYTVTVSDGIVKKIELDGSELPEFIVRTDLNTTMEFVSNYNQMSWLDKMQFLVVKMGVPFQYLGKIADTQMS